MKITLAYASEKFSVAVGYLASSTASLQARLAEAWTQELSMILGNDVTALPPEIQAKLSELSKKLYASESSGAGPDINSLVHALDEGQVLDAIDDIVSLNYVIAQAFALAGPGF